MCPFITQRSKSLHKDCCSYSIRFYQWTPKQGLSWIFLSSEYFEFLKAVPLYLAQQCHLLLIHCFFETSGQLFQYLDHRCRQCFQLDSPRTVKLFGFWWQFNLFDKDFEVWSFVSRCFRGFYYKISLLVFLLINTYSENLL